jgi:hypothetical protein
MSLCQSQFVHSAESAVFWPSTCRLLFSATVEDLDCFYHLFWQTTIGLSPSRGCNFPVITVLVSATAVSYPRQHSTRSAPDTFTRQSPSTPLHKSNVLFTSRVTKQIITAPLSLGHVLNWEILQDPQARRYGVRRTCCGKSFMEENFRFPVFCSPPSFAPCLWRPLSPFCGGKVGTVPRVMIHVHITSRETLQDLELLPRSTRIDAGQFSNLISFPYWHEP